MCISLCSSRLLTPTPCIQSSNPHIFRYHNIVSFFDELGLGTYTYLAHFNSQFVGLRQPIYDSPHIQRSIQASAGGRIREYNSGEAGPFNPVSIPTRRDSTPPKPSPDRRPHRTRHPASPPRSQRNPTKSLTTERRVFAVYGRPNTLEHEQCVAVVAVMLAFTLC